MSFPRAAPAAAGDRGRLFSSLVLAEPLPSGGRGDCGEKSGAFLADLACACGRHEQERRRGQWRSR